MDKVKVQEKVNKIKEYISSNGYGDVNIIAATKYMTSEENRILYECGIKEFGENRTDVFLEKYEALKDLDIKWHFFGYLHPRKAKDIIDKIDCLHTLDSSSLALEISKRRTEVLECFICVNLDEEPVKSKSSKAPKASGVPYSKVKAFVKSLAKYPNIKVVGLMCVSKFTFDDEVLKQDFSKLNSLKEEIEELYLDHAPVNRLSMGMSNDYKIALKCGSTDLRLGHIFLE